jgi:hypothetical protein
VGMIIVLHNFQTYKQSNICRLNSSYRSYYFEEKGKNELNDTVNEIHRIMALGEW